MKRLFLVLSLVVVICAFANAADPVQTYIKHIDRPVVLDGVLDEWDFCYQYDLDSNTVGMNRGFGKPAPEDISGTFMFQYDENGIYFAVKIHDDVPGVNDNLGTGDMWNGDVIELMFGNYDIGTPPSIHTSRIDTMGKLDNQFTIGYNSDEEAAVWLWGGGGHQWGDYDAEENVKVVINGTEVIIEGYLDFAAMEASPNGQRLSMPKPGAVMPAYVQIFDVDTYDDGGDFTLLGYGHNPNGWAGGQWDLGMEVVDERLDDQDRAEGKAIPYNHTFVRKAPARGVILDGNLDEWDLCFPFDLDSNTVGLNRGFGKPAPEDISGTAKFMWDEGGLYFGLEITDDVPGVNDNLGTGDMWNGDVVEIMIGNYDIGSAPSIHKSRIDTLGKLDNQFTIGYNADGETSVWLWGGGDHQWGDYDSEENVKVAIDGNKVIMEGYLDFDQIEASNNGQILSIPEVGSVMPFYVQFFDVDTYDDGGDFTLVGFGHNPNGWAGGQWDLGLTVTEYDEDNLGLLPDYAPDPVFSNTNVQSYIKYIDAPVVLDGVLNEWNFCYQLDLNENTVGGNRGWAPIPTADDISGTIMLQYDNGGIYFAADIIDDVPGVNDNLGTGDMWNGDVIELMFGNYDIGMPPSFHTSRIDTMGKLDNQFTIGYNSDEEAAIWLWSGGGHQFGEYDAEENITVSIDGNHVIIEGYLDFDQFEASPNGQILSIPSVGSVMPAYVQIFDVDTYDDGGDFTLLGYGHNPNGWAGGQWDLGLEVVDERLDDQDRAEGKAIPYHSPYARKAPEYGVVLDGNLDEWNLCFPFDLDSNTVGLNRGFGKPAPEDISGTAKFMWDEGGLYFGLEITDDVPGVNDNLGTGDMWNGDVVEIMIGNYNIGSSPSIHTSRIDTLGKLDNQFTIGYNADGETSVWLWGGGGHQWGDYDAEENVIVIIDGNKVIMEGYLQFDQIEASGNGQRLSIPEVGSVVPLYVQIFDVDTYDGDGDFTLLGYGHNPNGWAGGQWDLGLEITDYDENEIHSPGEVVDVAIDRDDVIVPTKMALYNNYPNPFNPTTNIRFDLSTQMKVTMEIYDIQGRKVRTLINHQAYSAGSYDMMWNGRNDANLQVATGVYFYSIRTSTQQITKKMLLIK